MANSQQMTHTQYLDFSHNIRTRAARVSQQIRSRAIAISAAKLGPTDGTCFLMAHNWMGQRWMTAEQNQAAREILYLERKGWETSTLADRIISKAWKRTQV